MTEDLSKAAMLESIMEMRSMASLIMTMKAQHPDAYINMDKARIKEMWATDISQLSHIIEQYDSLITRLLEINLQMGDLQDQMVERLNRLLPE